MVTSHEVTCISKTTNHDRKDHLTHLGGQSPFGRGWRVTVAEAIKGILAGKWNFFVTIGGKPQPLRVAVDRDGSRYLKLDETDGTQGLTKLPVCSNGHSTHPGMSDAE
jgi:hypothetical protein